MEVSSPDKLLFPADGITKAAVVDHYETVGARMLEFVAGRPLTVQRFPRGIEAKGFMQKNAADHYPESIARLAVPKRGGGETVYPVVDRAEDIAWLANQNTITFHMWTSSAAQPGQPDWMIIDLDPEAGDDGQARDATQLVADVLHEFGIDGFPLATGSKGFHIWMPLDGSLGFEQVSRASRAIAGLVVQREPALLTTEFLKKNRKGRVFVDWLRNGPTATVVVPFSLRPRPGAPVAVPLRWAELATARPNGWTIGAIEDRLDLDVAVEPQQLPVDEIVAAAREAGVDLDTPHDRFGRDRS
ncbi:MAG: ATP-dependent DNA ligase [Acidimicrobiales bacterium]|nr:ATP-dependent DNA ligase [Acidimicrobiales bacterium]